MAEPARDSMDTQAEESGLVDRLARDIDRLNAIVDSWEPKKKDTVAALRHALEDFYQAGLRELLAELNRDSAAALRLRDAVNLPVVYAMLRRVELLRPSMTEQVELALDAVRPALRQHGGDVELVELCPPDRVRIRLTGACDGCGASETTLREGVEKSLREHCDWLRHVDQDPAHQPASASAEQTVHFVSPFASARRQP